MGEHPTFDQHPDLPPVAPGLETAEEFEARVQREYEAAAVEKSKPPTTVKPVEATRFVWRDPSTIPPRRFLYGRHFARGFVGVPGARRHRIPG